jgi:hypothetical protein
MDEMERAHTNRQPKTVRDPERVHALESLRLARTELERQLNTATNEQRRTQLQQAIAEVDRRVAVTNAAPQR